MKRVLFVFLFGWLVFGALTFASFLWYWDWKNRLDFKLGFPFVFYHQFYIGDSFAHHGGWPKCLLGDVAFAWFLGGVLLHLIKRHF